MGCVGDGHFDIGVDWFVVPLHCPVAGNLDGVEVGDGVETAVNASCGVLNSLNCHVPFNDCANADC